MPRILALILLLSPIGTAFSAETETEVELPAAVERAKAEHRKEVEKAQKEYLEEVQDADEELMEDLEKELKRATKKGDLDVALAIKAEIQRIIDERPTTDFLGNPIPGTEATKKAPSVAERLCAQPWRGSVGFGITFTFIFDKDGGMRLQGTSRGGTWEIDNEEKLIRILARRQQQRHHRLERQQPELDL